MCNLTGVSKGKGLASNDGNIVGGVSNCVVIDKKKCVVADECVIEVKEADESELIGKRVSSIVAAFEVYNDYTFRKVFLLDVTSCGGERVHKRFVQGSFVAANKVLKGVPGKI